MKVDLETLKSQCLRVAINQVADPESVESIESANVLAQQLAGFADKFWYVWANHGDGAPRLDVSGLHSIGITLSVFGL